MSAQGTGLAKLQQDVSRNGLTNPGLRPPSHGTRER